MGRRRVATLLQLVLMFSVFSVITTVIEREEAQGNRKKEQEPMHLSPQERQEPQRLDGLELPPAPRWSTEEAKSEHRAACRQRRSTSSSSAIIFPGQAGYELTGKTKVVVKPVVDTPVIEFVETPEKTTPVKTIPGEGTPAEEEVLEIPECGGVPFRALDILSGQCRSLATRSGCAAGEWFVLDRETRLAACRPHPCPIGLAMLSGVCHDLSDSTVCAPNMVLQVDEFGDAACDCARGNAYWPAEERCYPALMRGPCAPGQQFTVVADGTACVENPCGRDGWVRWPKTGVCYLLRDINDAGGGGGGGRDASGGGGGEPCPHGRMEVDSDSLELVCKYLQLVAHFLGDFTPPRWCAVGTRLWVNGQCKRTLTSPSRPPLPLDSGCQSGFVETPNGECVARTSGGLG